MARRIVAGLLAVLFLAAFGAVSFTAAMMLAPLVESMPGARLAAGAVGLLLLGTVVAGWRAKLRRARGKRDG